MEHGALIFFQLAKGQFRQPIADKFPPVIQVCAACSGDKTYPHGVFDRQIILGISPVSAHEDSQFIGKRATSGHRGNRSQPIQDIKKL